MMMHMKGIHIPTDLQYRSAPEWCFIHSLDLESPPESTDLVDPWSNNDSSMTPWEEESFVNSVLVEEPEPISLPSADAADSCSDSMSNLWANSISTPEQDYSGLQAITTLLDAEEEDCADSYQIMLWSSTEEEPTIWATTTEETSSLQATDSIGASQEIESHVEVESSTIKKQTAAATETETLPPYSLQVEISSWSEEEDQILRAAMAKTMSSSVQQQQPMIPWHNIPQALPFKPPLEVLNRTNYWLQCFQRDLSSVIISHEQVADLAAASNPPMPNQKKRKVRTKWTDEEHKNFLDGIEMFGWGNWKEMAAANLIKTRTVSQITSHAQMYQKHTNVPIPSTNKRRKRT